MTIQSINAYNTDRPLDPRIDRTWATKVEIAEMQEQLQQQIDQLKIAVENNIEARNKMTEELSK